MVAFNTIPISVTRVPGNYVEFDSRRANQGLAAQPYRVLILAQMTSGTATPLEPVRISSEFAAVQAFGQGSMAHSMVRAYLVANSFTELWVVGLDDPSGGTKSTGTFTFTGAPTAAGTLFAYVGGRRHQIGVTASSTPTTIATALAAAIEADLNGSANATSTAGVVTVTARHSGSLGDEIGLSVNYRSDEFTPAGLTVAVAPMSGGAGFVDLDTVWPVLGDEWYNIIATPFTDSAAMASLETELSDRFGGLRQIDALACTAHSGDLAAVQAYGQTRNSQHVSCLASYASPSPTWEWSAAYSGVLAFEAANDPARPFQTVELPGILAPKPADRMKFADRNSLLFGGIATTNVDSAGVVRLEYAITTYQETPLGAPDEAYLKVNTLQTLSFLRFSLRARLATRFARSKLAEDGTRFGPGQAVVTPLVFKGEMIALFREWEDRGLVQDVEQFKNDLVVTKVGDRLEVILPPALINQLRATAVQIQFLTEAA